MVDLEVYSRVPDRYRKAYDGLLQSACLSEEGDTDLTALLLEGSHLVACGSLTKNLLKQIATDPSSSGEGACAAVVSALVKEAFARGDSHLFLCTKPEHNKMFQSFGFYPLVATDSSLLMENKRHGLENFLRNVPAADGLTGCVVCNCNPMTNGHLHLIRYAAERVDRLLVFVVSEDASLFPSEVRYELVRDCTAGISNVTVLHSREYLVSRATFPTYFIADPDSREGVRDDLDLELFASRIAPALHISVRFVGEEPYSAVTRAYNARMRALLPGRGIEVREISRYRDISASHVRRLLIEGKTEEIRDLVPPQVYAYCTEHTF